MGWRLHLSNQAIGPLAILTQREPILLAFTRVDRLCMFDLASGTPLHEGELALPSAPPPPIGLKWLSYFNGLRDVDGQFLPRVAARRGLDVCQTHDGLWRLLVHGAGAVSWRLGDDPRVIRLEDAERWVLVDFEPKRGLWCALDEQGRRHLYLRDRALNVSPPSPLRVQSGVLALALARDGRCFACDGRLLLVWDAQGQAAQHSLAFTANRLAISHEGARLALADQENGVLRLYRTRDGTQTHQKTAIDLMARAAQLQLLADLPPPHSAVSGLALTHSAEQGWLAFSMAGVVAVVSFSELDCVAEEDGGHLRGAL
jgi:hypothetical protein